jgi:hypothetical protein
MGITIWMSRGIHIYMLHRHLFPVAGIAEVLLKYTTAADFIEKPLDKRDFAFKLRRVSDSGKI